MASRIGLVTFHAESTRAQKTPSGRPTSAHNPTATRTIPMVRMVSTQYIDPSRPHIIRPSPAIMPTFGVRNSEPRITVKSTTWYQGSCSRKSLTTFESKKSNGHLTVSRNHWALASNQSTIWSNQYPTGNWNWSRTLVSERPTPSLRPVHSPVSPPMTQVVHLTGRPPARTRPPTALPGPSPP